MVAKPTKLDTESWDYVSQNGTDDEVLAFLNRENVSALNLDKIAFRMKDRAFFEAVIALLHGAARCTSPTLWSYGLLHNDAADGPASSCCTPISSWPSAAGRSTARC